MVVLGKFVLGKILFFAFNPSAARNLRRTWWHFLHFFCYLNFVGERERETHFALVLPSVSHAVASMSMNILAGALHMHFSGIHRWFMKPDVRVCSLATLLERCSRDWRDRTLQNAMEKTFSISISSSRLDDSANLVVDKTNLHNFLLAIGDYHCTVATKRIDKQHAGTERLTRCDSISYQHQEIIMWNRKYRCEQTEFIQNRNRLSLLTWQEKTDWDELVEKDPVICRENAHGLTICNPGRIIARQTLFASAETKGWRTFDDNAFRGNEYPHECWK